METGIGFLRSNFAPFPPAAATIWHSSCAATRLSSCSLATSPLKLIIGACGNETDESPAAEAEAVIEAEAEEEEEEVVEMVEVVSLPTHTKP